MSSTRTDHLARALAALYKRRNFGIKLGLGPERALLHRLGDPHLAYPVIHVAGTNGKGSVCAILESVLRAAGYRTGLYTSPHLVRFNERIRIAGACISDQDLAGLLSDVQAAVAAVEPADAGRALTFFEVATALAFEQFRRSDVEIAVVETGLGGRLDATNVVEPLLSVITRISLDHTEHLGPDLESIAAEKGGIIKRGRPVICGAMAPEARAVLAQIAAERNAAFLAAADVTRVTRTRAKTGTSRVRIESMDAVYGPTEFALLGPHQIENCATALTALTCLAAAGPFDITEQAVKTGLRTVRWPGRLQLLEPAPPLLLDGAHNPEAARALGDTLRQTFGKRPVGIVLGMCTDKDAGGILKQLGRVAARWWTVPIRNERSRNPDELANLLRARGARVEARSLPAALAAAQRWAAKRDGIVCVTGSLFLVGEVLELQSGPDIFAERKPGPLG